MFANLGHSVNSVHVLDLRLVFQDYVCMATTGHADELARLATRYRNATERLATARAELIKELRAAHAAGMRQMELVRAIDHEWTREYVAKILQASELDA
jgi:hypothetical protein